MHNLVKALLALRRRKKILRPVCSTGLAQLMPLVEYILLYTWFRMFVNYIALFADRGYANTNEQNPIPAEQKVQTRHNKLLNAGKVERLLSSLNYENTCLHQYHIA